MKALTYDEQPCPVPGLEGPCHISRGRPNRNGYTQVSIKGKLTVAHRFRYEQVHGPIPPGMLADHQCRVRNCINPQHIRIVTPRTNALENSNGQSALNILKTHCSKGHPFDQTNTLLYRGERACRTCRRACNKASLRRIRERGTSPLGTPD